MSWTQNGEKIHMLWFKEGRIDDSYWGGFFDTPGGYAAYFPNCVFMFSTASTAKYLAGTRGIYTQRSFNKNYTINGVRYYAVTLGSDSLPIYPDATNKLWFINNDTYDATNDEDYISYIIEHANSTPSNILILENTNSDNYATKPYRYEINLSGYTRDMFIASRNSTVMTICLDGNFIRLNPISVTAYKTSSTSSNTYNLGYDSTTNVSYLEGIGVSEFGNSPAAFIVTWRKNRGYQVDGSRYTNRNQELSAARMYFGDTPPVDDPPIFVGVNGKARQVKDIYVGVNGKARKVTAIYVGVNGKAREVFSSS